MKILDFLCKLSHQKYISKCLKFLMLGMLGKNCDRLHFTFFFFFYFFLKIGFEIFMQIVTSGDSLHEMSKPSFRENKKKIFQYVVC